MIVFSSAHQYRQWSLKRIRAHYRLKFLVSFPWNDFHRLEVFPKRHSNHYWPKPSSSRQSNDGIELECCHGLWLNWQRDSKSVSEWYSARFEWMKIPNAIADSSPAATRDEQPIINMKTNTRVILEFFTLFTKKRTNLENANWNNTWTWQRTELYDGLKFKTPTDQSRRGELEFIEQFSVEIWMNHAVITHRFCSSIIALFWNKNNNLFFPGLWLLFLSSEIVKCHAQMVLATLRCKNAKKRGSSSFRVSGTRIKCIGRIMIIRMAWSYQLYTCKSRQTTIVFQGQFFTSIN